MQRLSRYMHRDLVIDLYERENSDLNGKTGTDGIGCVKVMDVVDVIGSGVTSE